KALERGAIELALGLGEQVEHALALWVQLERFVLGATQNLATGVTGAGGVAARFLHDKFLRCAFDRGELALAVTEDEVEPAGVLGALGLLYRAGQGVLVEHLGNEDVAGNADA